ncbi:hypothetical protein K0040_15405 [Terrisporobacter petrolearius]|uniref:hypothetical protein n=1 Tax=Terrisporobacter petrolearius TaxID=1460447 RepID=UPI001D160B5B|nr:hypothetical protein [Terrisporobacter petrolearius]MCC3865649.1 hypothetical protein [Terrisporobacter petrolearius]
MKKLILALIVVLSLSTGCTKSNEKAEEASKEEKIIYCSECAAESKEVTKYCKDCGKEVKWVIEKPEIKNEEKEKDNEKTQTSNTSNKKQESEYERGYKDGYKDGYYKAQIDDAGGDGIINSKYDEGYSAGFNDGWIQCVTDGKDYESKKEKEEYENPPEAFSYKADSYYIDQGICPSCGSDYLYLLNEDEGYCKDCGYDWDYNRN